MKGLINLGNTCYFNSALQCMLHTPVFTNYFLMDEYTGECEFTKEYQKITRESWNQNKNTINPAKLLQLFRQKYSQFDNDLQHDSQEAFLCILDIFDKSLNELIHKLFYGVNIQETIYKSGKSVIKGIFNIIILNPKPDENKIGDILKSSQKWTGIENYEDNEGKNYNVAASRTIFEKMPIILVFSIRMYDSKKKIDFSEQLEIGDQKYKLYATSNHQGSINGGHYIAFTHHEDNWYIKDDTMVNKLKKFPNHDYHYLAFYQLIF